MSLNTARTLALLFVLAVTAGAIQAQTVARIEVQLNPPDVRESGAALTAAEIARHDAECRLPTDTTQTNGGEAVYAGEKLVTVPVSVPYEWGVAECRARAVDSAGTLGAWSGWVMSDVFPPDPPTEPSGLVPNVITITISVQGAN